MSVDEGSSVIFDTFKLLLALLIVLLAVVSFYWYGDQPLSYRVIGLLLSVGASVLVALQTDRGRQVKGYFYGAQLEVRRVVWPTRQETAQTTLTIIVVVIIVSLFLWGLDRFLAWGMGRLIGAGG